MKRNLLLFVLLALSRFAFAQNEPEALFLQSHYQSCTTPFTVTFKDTTWSPVHSSIVSWKWEFGDGTIDSSGPVVAHTYFQKGMFRTKLTVRDQEGRQGSYTAVDDQLIRVGAALQMPATGYVCNPPQLITLRNLATPQYFDSIGTYQWLLDGNVVSTARSWQTNQVGLYQLKYAACDTVLSSYTAIVNGTIVPGLLTPTVWLNDTAKLDFTILNSPYIPARVNLVSWVWGDGIVSEIKGLNNTVTHGFTAPGTYNVRAVARLNNLSDLICDTSGSYTLNIRQPYVKHNTWNKKDSLYKGTSVFIDAGNGGAAFKWRGTDPAFAASTQYATINKPGRYWVEISKSGDMIRDTIDIMPKFDFAIKLAPCNQSTGVNFTPDITVPVGDSLRTITWYYGDSTSDVYTSTIHYTHYYPAPGTYTAVMDVRLKSGYRKTVSKQVTVNDPGIWNVELQDDTVSMPGVHILTPTNVSPLGVGAKIRWWAQPLRAPTVVKSITDTIHAILPGLYVAHLIDSCGGIWTHDTVEVRDPFTSEWRTSMGAYRTSGCWDTMILSLRTMAPKGTYQVLWNTGETTDTIIATKTGRYSFVFTDAIGKKRKDSLDIEIYARDIATLDVRTKNGRDTLVAGPYNRNSEYFFYRNDTLLSTAQFNFNNLYGDPIPGVYKVQVRNLRGCMVMSMPLYYRVANDSVAVDFNYAADKCNNQQINFNGAAIPSNSADSVKNMTWYFGDGITETYPAAQAKVSHSYSKAGTYTVSFTATTLSGKEFGKSKQVIVSQTPAYSVNINIDTVSVPFIHIFKAVKSPENALVRWNTGSTNDTIHVRTSGTYIAWLTDSCGNVRAADTLVHTIDTTWRLDISVKQYFCNDSAWLTAKIKAQEAGAAITWNNGTQSDTMHIYASGTYFATLKDAKGNVRAVDSIRVTLPQPFTATLRLGSAYGRDTLIANPYGYNYIYKWYRDGQVVQESNYSLLHDTTRGKYVVSVKSDAGCMDISDTLYYKVAAPSLKVDYTYEPEACNPQGINFHGGVNTQDSIRSYVWNFGGQAQSAGSNIFRQFSAGTYTVSLTVTTFGGRTGTVSKQLVIPPVTPWTAQITKERNACGDTVFLTLSSTPEAAAYYWSTGASTRTIAVTTSGQYTGGVKDSCSNVQAMDTVEIVITKRLTAGIKVHTSPAINNDTLIAYPTQFSGYFYEWYKDGVKFTEGNIPHIYNPAAGIYQVHITNDTGCSATSDTIRYKPADVVIPVDISYEVSGCDSQFVRFHGIVETADDVTYSWNFGDQSSTEGEFVSHRFAPGTYNVVLTVATSSGVTGTVTRQLVITATKAIWVASITKQQHQCGDTVWLTAAANHTPVGYFAWNTGEQTNTITVTASGRYAVSVYDTCYNLRAYDSIDVTINAPCIPDIPGDTIDIGNGPVEGGKVLPVTAGFDHDFNADNIFTVQLTLQDPGGRETGIQPDEVINLGTMPGTTKDIAMQVDIPDSLACATSYAVRVVASSPADTTAWSQLFTITNQPPQPVITQRGDSLFTSGKYNWQWYFNDKPIDGATSANYRARVNGAYTVESHNGNGCSSKSSPVSVIITAVGEVTLGGNKVKAFPNPSAGQVSLQFEKPLLKAVTINVYNLNGRVMYTRTTTQQLQPLDLSGLPKGYYMIELTGYGQQKVLSLILQ